MPASTETPILTERFGEALSYAVDLHRTQVRKGGDIPYAGAQTLATIREKYGDGVAAIVAQCSDTDVEPKPPWRQRKQDYIDHLGAASDETILVSLADKLDNRSLQNVYTQRNDSWLVGELGRVLDELEARVDG